MADIYKILHALEELEDVAAQLYEKLSEHFKDNKEASFFFYKMSLDEISHRDLVKYQQKLVKRSAKDDFADIDIDISDIYALTARITQILSSSEMPSLNDAVKFAIEIESSAVEKHYRTAMKKANPDLAILLDSLGSSDKVHLTRLQEFYTKNKGK